MGGLPRVYQQHRKRWNKCTKCELSSQRSKVVLARGKVVNCQVLFLGEAPGVSEDVIGQPFVGPAGKLLDYIVKKALEGKYSIGYTNLVACFPRKAKASGNHEPPEECIVACHSRLEEFLSFANPKLVVYVGKLAEKYGPAIVESDRYCHDVGVVQIFHPAAILRMDKMQQPLALQRCCVAISSAANDVFLD